MKNAATDGKRNILVRCDQSAAGVTLTTQAIFRFMLRNNQQVHKFLSAYDFI
jgi:hypothetical protein